ncbi:hypothetical protein ACFQ60_05985 [Streptomyces zhihengii]
MPENRLSDGSPVPAFRVTTRQDGPIGDTDLTGPAAVGFFSTTCRPAASRPGLRPDRGHRPRRTRPCRRRRQGSRAGRRRARGTPLPVARVVVEADDANDPTLRPGVILASEAFGIVRWPSYVEIGADGRIANRESATELFTGSGALPAPQTV